MYDIEPYYNWRDFYIAEDDRLSPFYMREHSEFDFENTIYNYYIHPQWDDMGSTTLYLKVIFVDYHKGFAIIEFIGEWNDCITNDIMILKREIVDVMLRHGINKYILIGENVLNFHYDSDDYYEEWFDDVEDGWLAAVNFQPHVLDEMTKYNLDRYIVTGGELNDLDWRIYEPQMLFKVIENQIKKRLAPLESPGKTN